ncbi:F-box protein At1g22220-like [Eucalyptus grandis]|uniref:F-box protein At1g22220-like n=1 Tax=Eucalyptus grandis TaxID=71139 RepID=UPI00192EDA47|nr:F-box protein At1g22220-like [Eucalyptus grandis]
MDCFDRLPDSIIVDIFNAVSDVKSLACCAAVSRRFNALVPHADALLLRVDRVVPEPDPDSLLPSFLRTLLSSVHHLLSPRAAPEPPNYPARVLRGFSRMRDLEIELPSGDLMLEKGTVVRYRAAFGERLRSCVILGFRHWRGGGGAGEAQDGFGEGLTERVAWIVSALVGASARHRVAKEVATEHEGLARLAVRDRDGEGEVVMDKLGLREAATAAAVAARSHGEGPRTVGVSTLRMSMRHQTTVEIAGGAGMRLEVPMLVVVRPDDDDGAPEDDAELALEAFGSGVYGEVVRALLKSKSYSMEMNSY